jgi:hypothetical protein
LADGETSAGAAVSTASTVSTGAAVGSAASAAAVFLSTLDRLKNMESGARPLDELPATRNRFVHASPIPIGSRANAQLPVPAPRFRTGNCHRLMVVK